MGSRRSEQFTSARRVGVDLLLLGEVLADLLGRRVAAKELRRAHRQRVGDAERQPARRALAGRRQRTAHPAVFAIKLGLVELLGVRDASAAREHRRGMLGATLPTVPSEPTTGTELPLMNPKRPEENACATCSWGTGTSLPVPCSTICKVGGARRARERGA